MNPLTNSCGKVKAALTHGSVPAPVGDEWRVKYLGKLLEARGEANYAGEDTSVLTGLIGSLCFIDGGGVPPHYDTICYSMKDTFIYFF